MKYLLTLIICSGVSGDCQQVNGYPIIKDSYPICILDGMIESHKFVTRTFTYDQIEKFRVIPKYTCTPVKET